MGKSKEAEKWSGAETLRASLVPIHGLVLDARNARLHTERNLRAIADSLSRFGQLKPIVVSENGGIIAGNGTVEAIREHLDWTHVAATTFKGTHEEAVAFAIADNRTAELAEWDLPELADHMQELLAAGWDLDDIGWQEHEYAPLLDAEWEPRAPVKTGDEETGPNVRVVFDKDDWPTVRSALTLLRTEEDLTDGAGLTRICREWMDGRA